MKRLAMLAMLLALCLSACGACALTMAGLETDVVDRMWETNLFFSRMGELTGVNVKAHGVSDAQEYDALLAQMKQGGAAYDALFKANLSREQEIELLDSGAIIDLAPYIEEHMPNLSALLRDHPQWREIIALEDGRIASLPLLNMQERQVCMWINRAWLDKLGMAMPVTLEELTAALEAIRSGDPNENGRQDEFALDLTGVYEMRWLLPYFGIVADDYHLTRNDEGKIVFAPELPEYRVFIEQLKAWHDAGILRGDAFTSVHSTAVLSDEENETTVSGMLLSMTPYTHVPVNAVADYEPLLLAGPDGNIRWRDLLGEVWTGCFAVTGVCSDVEAALRWVDALYTAETPVLAYAGVENEDYYITGEGYWAFLIDDRRTINDIRSDVLIYTGTAMPGLYPAEFIGRVDSVLDRHVFAASERVRAVSERVTQAYSIGAKEQARADELSISIGTLVDTGIARFVTGEVELTDETYAAWLEQLKAAGCGELAALFEAAQ